jgi:Alpha/beta hydrolase domain
MRIPLREALAILSTVLGCMLCGPPGAGAVPNPTVTGPIPANATPGDPSHDYPFFSFAPQLAALKGPHDYVEEEFFFEGTANRYTIPTGVQPNSATGAILDGGHSYKTRLIVRRPARLRDFKGTVFVEWLNVTAGYDIEAQWTVGWPHMVDEGAIYVGVSAQRVGVQGGGPGSLTVWSPARYGSLDVTDGGTITNDALSYDIFSQAGQAIAHPMGVDPLVSMRSKVERVIMTGASQSAGRLQIYFNSVRPLDPIYDALLLIVGGNMTRTDQGIKVFKFTSETDAPSQLAARQPDTDEFRHWEVAGAAHADFYFNSYLAPLGMRDGIPPTPTNCDDPPLSRMPFYEVGDAAGDALVRWMTDGTSPPIGPPIEFASTSPPVIARDALGLAIGGIRLPDIVAPLALNTGQNSGPAFCLLFGTYIPFDDATLHQLYASRGDWISEFTQASRDAYRAGFIGKRDHRLNLQRVRHTDLFR